MYKSFEWYKIQGFKLKYIPTNVRGLIPQNGGPGGAGVVVGPTITYDDPNTYDATGLPIAGIMEKDYNKLSDPTRTLKHYVNLKGYSKKLNLQWQRCENFSSVSFNTLGNGSTVFRQEIKVGSQISEATTIAFLKATWYVTFKGQA